MKFQHTLVRLLAVMLSAFAVNVAGAEDLPSDKPSQWETYGQFGFPGVGVGVGYGINERFTVRADAMTIGRFSKDFTERSIKYQAHARSNKFNIRGDYFPMNNPFRVTAGLGFGRTKLSAEGHSVSEAEQKFKIGGQTYSVKLTGDDKVDVQTRYPAVSPYVGIGWGHNVAQRKAGTWSITADLGMYVGKPKTDVTLSSTLNQKLVDAQAELSNRGVTITDDMKQQAQSIINQRVDDESAKIRDRIQKYNVIPVVMVGISYNF